MMICVIPPRVHTYIYLHRSTTMNKKEQWLTSQIKNDEEVYERVDQELSTMVADRVQFYLNVLETDRTTSEFFEYVGDFVGHYNLIMKCINNDDQVDDSRICLWIVQFLIGTELTL